MHNNYYFLRKLTTELQYILQGAVMSECFSQTKDELIIRFETTGNPFFVKASLQSDFCCLSFPDDFNRARKNSVDLFSQLIGQRVLKLTQFENERSFSIEFHSGLILLFKMHGNRSNLVVFKNGQATDLFRNHLQDDLTLHLPELNRTIDWSFETFQKSKPNLSRQYFTFGKVIWGYLGSIDFEQKSITEQWETIQSVKHKLEQGKFYLTNWNNAPILSLLPIGTIEHEFSNALEASNEFFYFFSRNQALTREKNQAVATLKSNLKGSDNYIKKNKAKLQELTNDAHYKLWADLLMANLHVVKPGTEKVTLIDFYTNSPLEIKLKREFTAQKNAEVFYRKAKNQQIEITKLTEAIQKKESDVESVINKIKLIETTNDLKVLRSFTSELKNPSSQKQKTETVPYHEFEYKGFRIWVGKNAASNDVLTLKHTYKEDLWLHVKDISGSHVVIKYQSGKPFPKDVIERAAQLAAYNSKRKNETLCPVIFTPKKYVRKRKGDLPGAVVVEREEVILVEPQK